MGDLPWLQDAPIMISWSGIDFSTRPDAYCTPRWVLRDTDWWDGATESPDTIRMPRGVAAGEEYFSPRTVSWSGMLECESRVALLEQMLALQSARGTVLEVQEVDFGRQAVCRKAQARVTPISDRFATFSVVVTLDDPLVSSIDLLPLANSRSIRNDGAVHSRPVVRVTAPGVAPTVTIGGWSVKAPRAMVGSEVFTVDCRTGTLYLGTSAVFPVLAEFPAIAPGASVTVSTSAGSGTVDGVSAWI